MILTALNCQMWLLVSAAAHLGCISPSSSTYSGLAKTPVSAWISPDKFSLQSKIPCSTSVKLPLSFVECNASQTHLTPRRLAIRIDHLMSARRFRPGQHTPRVVMQQMQLLNFGRSSRLKSLLDQFCPSACTLTSQPGQAGASPVAVSS